MVDESPAPQEPTNEGLCAIIVAYRSLGLFKQEARNAMIELAKRKDSGSEFDSEGFIKAELEKVPKSQVNPEVARMLASIAAIGAAR